MPVPAEMYQGTHLLPSILSADFARLGQQIELVMDAGVQIIHVDIMDGHFVPNLTVGPVVVEKIAPLVHARGGYLSVHLMVEEPDRFLEGFVRAGADALSVHVEACVHLHRTVSAIKELGAGAGVAINPGTDLCWLGEAVHFLDFALVMTVNPGFGGQKFIVQALDKVRRLRRQLPPEVGIEVDGGINRDNISSVAEAGGNWLVAGSAVYHASDVAAEVRYLRTQLGA
jgi:ribulose-phosphate 3-epimerase